MSKFALEAYATSLRQELSVVSPPLRVCMVHAGPVATPLTTKRTQEKALQHVEASNRTATLT